MPDRTIMPQDKDTPDEPLLVPGQMFGQFKIVSALGSGGMGQVYRARHMTLDEDFAIKILHPEITSNPAAIERLRIEARVAFHLKHPNVVNVEEFNEKDGKFYLRMPLMHGLVIGEKKAVSLREVLTEAGGRLTEGDAAIILHDILSGLAYAHEHGVIHRDLKPRNILFNSTNALISDFGLVRIMGEDFFRSRIDQTMTLSVSGLPSSSLTSGSSSLIGTYTYMSPEQKLRGEADERSDVYAMGLIAFEMLTGRTSFGMRSPSKSADGISKEWDAFLGKALEPDKSVRFANAGAMLAEIPRIRASASLMGHRKYKAGQTPEKHRRTFLLLASVGALLSAGALGLFLLLPGKPLPKPASNAPETVLPGAAATMEAPPSDTPDEGAAVTPGESRPSAGESPAPAQSETSPAPLPATESSLPAAPAAQASPPAASPGGAEESPAPVPTAVAAEPAPPPVVPPAGTNDTGATERQIKENAASGNTAPSADAPVPHPQVLPGSPDAAPKELPAANSPSPAPLSPPDTAESAERVSSPVPASPAAPPPSPVPLQSGTAPGNPPAAAQPAPEKLPAQTAAAEAYPHSPAPDVATPPPSPASAAPASEPPTTSLTTAAPAAAAPAPPADRTWLEILLPGDVTLRMRRIEPCRFPFGSPDGEIGRIPAREGAQRTTLITHAYYIAEYELTQAQYEALMGSNPSRFLGANSPVEQISYAVLVQQNGLLDRLNKWLALKGLSHLHARLPSEEEWECACRAGTRGAFGDGSDLKETGNAANVAAFALCNKPFGTTAKVGTLAPNAWGLYDMHGNVEEITVNGVLRGGSFKSAPRDCRSAARRSVGPNFRGDERTGVRLVIVDDTDKEESPEPESH